MKKITLCAVIAVFSLISVQAQEEKLNQTTKGKWLFGSEAGISFASSSADFEFDGEDSGVESKVSSFRINPNVGYFVIDNLSIGLDVDFTALKPHSIFLVLGKRK